MSADGTQHDRALDFDLFDLELFRALQRDGRTPYTALAERFGVSEAQVRRRVRSLVDSDAVSIVAVADPALLGVTEMAWVGIVVSSSQVDNVAGTLADQPDVSYVVVSSGTFNVMVETACTNREDLYALLLFIRRLGGVQRTETFMYLRLLRQQFEWADEAATQARNVEPIVEAPPGGTLDDLDRGIVRLLQDNGRASFKDVARALSVSERTVSTRFARLRESGFVRVLAVGNPASMGFDAMAWLGINLRDGGDLEETIAALSRVPEISYLVCASGRFDLMAELVCRDRQHLLETLSTHVSESAGVGRVETFFYLRLIYRTAAGAWGAGRRGGKKARKSVRSDR